MSRRAAQMELSIELDSEPIAGSISVDDGIPQPFCGWIELVATIESARNAAGAGEILGLVPGANSGPM